MTPEERFKRMVEEPDSFKCTECGQRMVYKGNEVYQCSNCDNSYLTDYGKIKEYLRTHGGCSMVQLANATGVKLKKIQKLIEGGDIQQFF